MKLPEDSGSFVRELGGWGKYHAYLHETKRASFSGDALRRLPQSSKPKISRNAPCPCDSGKKFKKCCILTGKEKE
jgi:hypothetical protein